MTSCLCFMASLIENVRTTMYWFLFLDCKDLPSVPNAETVEYFGLQRQFNMGNKYTCHDNYKMQGRPFAVCQNTGDWKIMLTCIYGNLTFYIHYFTGRAYNFV